MKYSQMYQWNRPIGEKVILGTGSDSFIWDTLHCSGLQDEVSRKDRSMSRGAAAWNMSQMVDLGAGNMCGNCVRKMESIAP